MKDLYCFGVGGFGEWSTHYFFEIFDVARFTLLYELEITHVVLQNVVYAELDVSFGTFHCVENICEG